jgi:hypothetical protein
MVNIAVKHKFGICLVLKCDHIVRSLETQCRIRTQEFNAVNIRQISEPLTFSYAHRVSPFPYITVW